MRVKVRREYLLKELEHSLKVLQKDSKNKLGIAQLKNGETTLCAFVSCDMCTHFDEDYSCASQEVLNIASFISMLRHSRGEYIEIEVKGKELEF